MSLNGKVEDDISLPYLSFFRELSKEEFGDTDSDQLFSKLEEKYTQEIRSIFAQADRSYELMEVNNFRRILSKSLIIVFGAAVTILGIIGQKINPFFSLLSTVTAAIVTMLASIDAFCNFSEKRTSMSHRHMQLIRCAKTCSLMWATSVEPRKHIDFEKYKTALLILRILISETYRLNKSDDKGDSAEKKEITNSSTN